MGRFRIYEEDENARDDAEPDENEVIPARDGVEERGRDEGDDEVGHPVRDGR